MSNIGSSLLISSALLVSQWALCQTSENTTSSTTNKKASSLDDTYPSINRAPLSPKQEVDTYNKAVANFKDSVAEKVSFTIGWYKAGIGYNRNNEQDLGTRWASIVLRRDFSIRQSDMAGGKGTFEAWLGESQDGKPKVFVSAQINF